MLDVTLLGCGGTMPLPNRWLTSLYVQYNGRGILVDCGEGTQIAMKEAGCSAVFVSHHHGRIPFGIAPVQILPEIRKALQGSGMAVFCDCSIDDGYDAYKALALGADAVSVGRGILAPLLKEGKYGVIKKIQRMNEQLSELMMYTGISDTSSFDPSVLYL